MRSRNGKGWSNGAASALLIATGVFGSFACTGAPDHNRHPNGSGGNSGSGGTDPTGSGGTAGAASGGEGASGGNADVAELPFLHVSGSEVVDENDASVLLRGIAFGNDVWSNPTVPLTTHHNEDDFERIAEWGANAVRFYLNYRLFEDDAAPLTYKQAGFDYLDQNIAWAKAHGVYLILNMHVPEGGFQSNGDGDALWTDPDLQDRLIALWTAIAEHCRGESTIAGYDLVNEPRPLTARSEWEGLANRLIEGIREVDPEHMLVVERTNSVGEDWSYDANMNLFRVPDENVMYEFHFYDPFDYTTQLAEWAGTGEGGKYPDESVISGSNLTWANWNYEPAPPPYPPPGDSPWTLYESEPYVIDNPDYDAIGITLISELNSGKVWFDDIFVDEYDAEGVLVGRVFEQDLESLDGWFFWKEGDTGTASVSPEHHSGIHSLSIQNTDHDAGIGGGARIPVKPGYAYAVGGYMKGEAISDDSRPDPRGDWTQVSRALIRLDYYTATGPLLHRNQDALAATLDRFTAWGEAEGVPLFVGEFGLIHFCYEDDRGGTNWVADMMDLMKERELHFTYHAYHEQAFGIFQSPATQLPDLGDANQPLIDTLTAGLSN